MAQSAASTSSLLNQILAALNAIVSNQKIQIVNHTQIFNTFNTLLYNQKIQITNQQEQIELLKKLEVAQRGEVSVELDADHAMPIPKGTPA